MKKTDWYKNAVVYQIYPFSFMDANNDGWGDIEGIISKLDYLVELGITAIWFSPLYKSPDCDFGYDISDYRDIDPKFGTLSDFKKLLKACHSRKIKVIMDMVLNHSSTEHEWFKKALKDKNSPYRNYYIIRKGKKKNNKVYPPTNWDSTFTGSAWERINGTDDFYLHLFCKEQADFNWENDKLRNEIADIFNFWLKMGVDGFRLDVFNLFSKVYPLRDGKKKVAGTGEEFYVDGPRMHEFLHEMNIKAFSKYDSFTVGESYHPHEEDAKKYVAKESKELDTIFNFAHLESDNIANLKYFKKPFSIKQFKDGLFIPQIENFKTGWNTLVLENHDNARSVSRFGIDTKKYRYEAATFLAAITFLGFGTPFIFQGEEIGMTNADFKSIDELKDPVSHFVYGMMRKFAFPEKIAFNCIKYGARDNSRTPMQWNSKANGGFNKGKAPWQCMNENYREINVENDLKSRKSIFRFYQNVLKIKKGLKSAVYGEPKLYDTENKKVICYTRMMKDEGFAVIGNFSKRNVKFKGSQDFSDTVKKCLGFKNIRNEEVAATIKAGKLLSNYGQIVEDGGAIKLRPYEVIVSLLK